MKKIISILTLALAAVILAGFMASCSNTKTLSGTYSGEIGIGALIGSKGSYTFKGKNVTISITSTLLGETKTTEYKGTYEIKEATDGTLSIVFDFEDSDASSYNGSKTFSQSTNSDGKDTIVIGGATFTKSK